ncbi:anaphase promoting complex, Cdc20, Cdh1, and Ama1 subunits [Scheffersomyces amazonensis]|uniref:anaphase promoting complex, Cdc20, Cdh1, and Ama1 subunits n=1 Tax=Scheffersomyces amazonensis TaxID=1078765 RepID=UPI00315D8F52
MSSLFFESPTSKKIEPLTNIENNEAQLNLDVLRSANKKRTHQQESPTSNLSASNQPTLSPSKRLYLQSMSPNVTNKTIYLQPSRSSNPKTNIMKSNHKPSSSSIGSVLAGSSSSSSSSSTSTSSSSAANSKDPTKSRFVRPPLLKPLSMPSNLRSKSSTGSFSRNSISPSRKLRRTNSLISQGGSSSFSENQQQSSTTSSDRFIPSRHNSTCGKLESSMMTINLNPNSSPQSHIKAQTSKIYQHHVAEACGIEMNSRILMYQPLPPERKKPINLFNHISGNNSNLKSKLLTKSSLRPAIASARASKIPTAPERVLDAPGFVDDFYLNLLAWSSTNLLAIGLEDAVYIWNASTGSVGILCELPNKTLVTSLRWSDDGSYISIGKEDGLIEIWDIESNTKLRTLNCDNHQTRIACQSWNNHMLTSGSRIGNIYHSDVRSPQQITSKAENIHTAEVCGIEYRSDGIQFASGGNDNLVSIWDVRQSHSSSTAQPLFTKTNHKAAVKALSWCPYQSSLLATGGGSTDKTINFWNTTTGARVNTIETGSQISSLNWGYANGIGLEIVATHGYPTNNVTLYNYPTLQKTGEIVQAHDSRILNGCLSPDNLTLATVAGDENLKFWSLFDLYKNNRSGINDGRINDDYDNEESDLIGNDDTKTIRKMMSFR